MIVKRAYKYNFIGVFFYINETEKDEYIRISNTLIAIANCKNPDVGNSTIQIKYDEKDERLRIILWGSIKFVENILSTIEMLIES